MELHRWVFELEAWRKQQGQEGGEANASTIVVEEAQSNVGCDGDGPEHVRGWARSLA